MIMKYQKIINLWEIKTNQPSKLKAKTWVQVNDDSGSQTPIVKINLKLQL